MPNIPGYHGADPCPVREAGIAPDICRAYRVSDSPQTSSILPPHFALVVGFARRYDTNAGVGTLVALMLPYTVATAIAWIAVFFIWFLLGLPFGPQ